MHPKRIDFLTDEQAAMLSDVRDEWLAVGLSTKPADRAAAEDGVRSAYRRAGLEPPKLMVWLDSPLAGRIGAAVLGQVAAQIGGQVTAQVWGQVAAQIGGQVTAQVWGQVRDQVRGQVWDQVADQVYGQVTAHVMAQLREQTKGQARDQSRYQIWGQHDAGFLSWCDAMQRLGVAGIDIDGLTAVAQNAGWWWPMRDAAILTDRPDTLRRDPQGRLHCTTGPALRYRDGWGVYAVHGVRVPADLIEDGWDVQRVLSEDNAEVRRAAIELTGWDRFMHAAGMRLVASAPDPGNHPHTLELYDLPDNLRDMYDDEARILLCTNGSAEPDGTRRRYGLPVPATHDDPVAAAADLYGWPVEAYRRLEIRR